MVDNSSGSSGEDGSSVRVAIDDSSSDCSIGIGLLLDSSSSVGVANDLTGDSTGTWVSTSTTTVWTLLGSSLTVSTGLVFSTGVFSSLISLSLPECMIVVSSISAFLGIVAACGLSTGGTGVAAATGVGSFGFTSAGVVFGAPRGAAAIRETQ